MISTIVPHSGRESSKRTPPLCEDGGRAPRRTTATFPRSPGPLHWQRRLVSGSQIAGFMVAPSGATPSITNRHKAISSLRARATTITLRTRRPVEPMRLRNQVTGADPGTVRLTIKARPRSYTAAMPTARNPLYRRHRFPPEVISHAV